MLGFGALVLTPTLDGRWPNVFGLTAMDGNWYRLILNQGYLNYWVPGVNSAWPFFPLYPWLADGPTRLGAPVGPSLIAISWLSALVALGGVAVLVSRRFDRKTTILAVWLMALLPGSIGLVLSYSDSLFVAGQVWALVVIDGIARSRTAGRPMSRWAWWQVGTLTAVATASRPNGFLLVIVALVAVWCIDRRWRAAIAATVPSAVFLIGWIVYCERKVGRPFVFLLAKDAWIEWPIWRFVLHPLSRDALPFHVGVAVVVVAVASPSLRRLPVWWLWSIVLLVVPSLLLGVEGLARYVTLAAPLPVACALTLSQRPVWVQRLAVVVATVGFLFLGCSVVRYSWVP